MSRRKNVSYRLIEQTEQKQQGKISCEERVLTNQQPTQIQFLHGMIGLLQSSKRSLFKAHAKQIAEWVHYHEKKTYSLQSSDEFDYLKLLQAETRGLNSNVQRGLDEQLKERIQRVANGIQLGAVQLLKRKRRQLPRLAIADIIAREKQLQSNLVNLRSDLDDNEFFSSNTLQVEEQLNAINPEYYSLRHPRTKQAAEFTRKMKQLNEFLEKQRIYCRSKKLQEELLAKEERKRQHDQKLSERRNRLSQEYTQRLRKRYFETIENGQKAEKARRVLLNIYNPLFRSDSKSITVAQPVPSRLPSIEITRSMDESQRADSVVGADQRQEFFEELFRINICNSRHSQRVFCGRALHSEPKQKVIRIPKQVISSGEEPNPSLVHPLNSSSIIVSNQLRSVPVRNQQLIAVDRVSSLK